MKKAFTLVELLVVIAIISILSAALYGGTIYAMRVARRQACRGHLKTIGIATQAYEAENAGKLLVSEDAHPMYRFGKLIYLGMLENSQILMCPECPYTGADATSREKTFTKDDFVTGTGDDVAYNPKAAPPGFVDAIDYALQNCKIPDRLINLVGYSADGFHDPASEDMYNHENYGSILYKGGNVVGITGAKWWGYKPTSSSETVEDGLKDKPSGNTSFAEAGYSLKDGE